jgi:hypothetical protein
LKKTLENASLKKRFLQKPFEKICKNPLMQEFYENGLEKEKPTLRWKKLSQNSFQKPLFSKRKPCRNHNKDIA